MSDYIIGKPFPAVNEYEGREGGIARLNEHFFDIYYYVREPKWPEIRAFSKGKLRYGVYKKNYIPFLILHLAGIGCFDAYLNIFDLSYSDAIDKWLNLESNTINIYIINSTHNILEAVRTLSLRMDVAEEIRDILEMQAQKYGSSSAVDDMNLSIELSSEKMMERCIMVQVR